MSGLLLYCCCVCGYMGCDEEGREGDRGWERGSWQPNSARAGLWSRRTGVLVGNGRGDGAEEGVGAYLYGEGEEGEVGSTRYEVVSSGGVCVM